MIKIKGRAGEVPEVACIHVNVVRVDCRSINTRKQLKRPTAARPGSGRGGLVSCKHEPIPPPFLHPILSRACLESSISSYVERSKTKERAAAGAGPSVLAGRWAWALATAHWAVGLSVYRLPQGCIRHTSVHVIVALVLECSFWSFPSFKTLLQTFETTLPQRSCWRPSGPSAQRSPPWQRVAVRSLTCIQRAPQL